MNREIKHQIKKIKKETKRVSNRIYNVRKKIEKNVQNVEEIQRALTEYHHFDDSAFRIDEFFHASLQNISQSSRLFFVVISMIIENVNTQNHSNSLIIFLNNLQLFHALTDSVEQSDNIEALQVAREETLNVEKSTQVAREQSEFEDQLDIEHVC